MKEGVSVCITAYKVKDYIKECLDSVVNQSWFKTHDNWEIIVGVDGCEETLEYLKTIMHLYKHLQVFMMDSNRGTYITSNTIMSNATYENLFRFDSDDIMRPNLVETIMNKKEDNVLVRYCMKDFGGIHPLVAVAHGTIYIKKSVFLKYGGFRAWTCGADTEIYSRLQNIEKVKTINDILMLRRVHNDSLYHSKETGRRSELRKKYRKFIKDQVINTPADAIIKCEKNTFRKISSSLEGTVDKDDYIKNINLDIYFNPKQQKPVNRLLEARMEARMKAKTKPSTSSNIAKLRKDIETGKLVRVPVVGGFVWKRVKL